PERSSKTTSNDWLVGTAVPGQVLVAIRLLSLVIAGATSAFAIELTPRMPLLRMKMMPKSNALRRRWLLMLQLTLSHMIGTPSLPHSLTTRNNVLLARTPETVSYTSI